MAIETNVAPTGTGQAGASTPVDANQDVPVHLNGEPEKKLDHLANRAAGKGFARQQREDPTEFTK
jgi:hypothetical protein